MKLPRWNRGEPITAADLNRIAEATEAALEVVAGRGLTITRDPRGRLQVALDASGAGVALLCRVERVVNAAGANIPTNAAALPSQCRYIIRDLASGQLYPAPGPSGQASLLPVYGREVNADEAGVWPAKVGDLCTVWMNPRRVGGQMATTAELDIWSERVARGPC
jgi:hypothetical protein